MIVTAVKRIFISMPVLHYLNYVRHERLSGYKLNLYKKVYRTFSPCWPPMEVTLSVTPNPFHYLLGHRPPQRQHLNN